MLDNRKEIAIAAAEPQPTLKEVEPCHKKGGNYGKNDFREETRRKGEDRQDSTGIPTSGGRADARQCRRS